MICPHYTKNMYGFITFTLGKTYWFCLLCRKNSPLNLPGNRETFRFILWETEYEYYFEFDNSPYLQLWVVYGYQIWTANTVFGN